MLHDSCHTLRFQQHEATAAELHRRQLATTFSASDAAFRLVCSLCCWSSLATSLRRCCRASTAGRQRCRGRRRRCRRGLRRRSSGCSCGRRLLLLSGLRPQVGPQYLGSFLGGAPLPAQRRGAGWRLPLKTATFHSGMDASALQMSFQGGHAIRSVVQIHLRKLQCTTNAGPASWPSCAAA